MRYDTTINKHVERFISDKTLETYRSKFGQEFIDWYDPTNDELNATLTYLDSYVYSSIDDFESLLNELEKFNEGKSIMRYDDLDSFVESYIIEVEEEVIPTCIYVDYAKHAESLIRDMGYVCICLKGNILNSHILELRGFVGEELYVVL